MGKRQPDTGAPPLTAKKTKRREDTPGLTNINQTPLDNPGSHGRIQTMAYTAQQPGVHEPLDDTPPETAEHPRFSSGKRKLYATLERAIEQNTQIFTLLAARFGAEPAQDAVDKSTPNVEPPADAPVDPPADAPTEAPADAPASEAPAAPSAAATPPDHPAQDAAAAPQEPTAEEMPAEEEDAVSELIDLLCPGNVLPEEIIAMGTFLWQIRQPATAQRLDNNTLGLKLMKPLGLTAGETTSMVRVMRMNRGVVTCVRIRDHLRERALASPALLKGPSTSAVPYSVVAGAGDPAKPIRSEFFNPDRNQRNGKVHFCQFHGWGTHTTRVCREAPAAEQAAAQAAYEAEEHEKAQRKGATDRRQEIIQALSAGKQVSKEQLDFLASEQEKQDELALTTVATTPAPTLPASDPEVSLGPDLHLDLTNLSASRGMRVQLPNPEHFDGDLRKLIPERYRTPADYVHALAATAIRSEMPLPELTQTFFRGTAKTWAHQVWLELKESEFPDAPHCLTDKRYTKQLAVAFLLKFEQHFSAQLRQRSTVAMETFLSDAYHQQQSESVALYFARFTNNVHEAGGFTEQQKVIYFRTGLRPDLRKWTVVDHYGKEFDTLSDIFQYALAQERRQMAFSALRPTVSLAQPSLAYVQGGRSGRGGGRSGRGARSGGRTPGGRNGGRERDFTGRASGGVQKHRSDPAHHRGGAHGGRAQGHAHGHAQGYGRDPPSLPPPPAGMTWSARMDPTSGTYSYVLVRSHSPPRQQHYGAEPARGRGGNRGRGRPSGYGGKYHVAHIDDAHVGNMPLPPPLDLHYDAGAEGSY